MHACSLEVLLQLLDNRFWLLVLGARLSLRTELQQLISATEYLQGALKIMSGPAGFGVASGSVASRLRCIPHARRQCSMRLL